MRAVVLRKVNTVAWMLMPAFTHRIRHFDRMYTVDGNASNIADLFEQCFAAGDNRMLGIALFDNDPETGQPLLKGHLIAGVDMHHGVNAAVIYQYEKDDKDPDPVATNDAVQAIVDAWVQTLGLKEVSALATSKGRAKHFERWGYRFTSVLVTRSIEYGREEWRNQQHEHAAASVASADPTAASGGVS